MLNTTKSVHSFLLDLCDRQGWDCVPAYGEPGYGSTFTTAIVLGNFWTTVDGELRDFFHKYPRIQARLADEGVEFEWSDEWVYDPYTDKAYRTQPDCYGWTPSIAWTNDGDLLTPDDTIESWIDYALNTTSVALTRTQVPNVEARLVEAGWTRQPADGGVYEHGWHPGQTDNPTEIDAALRATFGDIDVVFVITSVGQFDVRFVAYYKAI